MFDRKFIRSVLTHTSKLPAKFARVWTDSRTVQRGDLFAAIPGEKFDGHDFVKMASERGALGAIVSAKNFKDREKLPQKFALIEVKDTTEALRKLARAYRKKLKIPIFAVAGSNGKTTTKEWLSFLLGEIHGQTNIFKTEKSQNSILGIALSLLQIRREKFAVIEIGIDEPGWMDQHLEVVAPTHGLITTIAEEHLNRLKNIETIAAEELKLLKYIAKTKGGFAANQDCSWIRAQKLPENSLTYGLTESAQIEGAFAPPQILSAFGIRWMNPLPGAHNAQNLLAAITSVRLLHPKIKPDELHDLSKTISRFQGEAHRSRLMKLSNDIQLFDDCYNANPDSMEKALKAFTEVAHGCRQHAVLGDMLDLGESSTEAHQRILNLAIVMGIDKIYLYGPSFKQALEQAVRPPENVNAFSSLDELSRVLRAKLQPTDMIFVKGSRGMALEKLIDKVA
jgi:UDP-N-acetylmuramoyl-tripeptide--D-alanyl-D-alanine ligase